MTDGPAGDNSHQRAPIVEEYWYSIDWDVEAVWKLDLPVETMPIEELAWHLEVPIWPLDGVGYVITPNQVMTEPTRYAEEHQRVIDADLSYPIDVIRHKGRWMILDGIHRLTKAVERGDTVMRVRKVPRSAVWDIV